MAGAALCEPPCADFVAGAALCEHCPHVSLLVIAQQSTCVCQAAAFVMKRMKLQVEDRGSVSKFSTVLLGDLGASLGDEDSSMLSSTYGH